MLLYEYRFFFNDTATTEIYTYLHILSLHDALPIWPPKQFFSKSVRDRRQDSAGNNHFQNLTPELLRSCLVIRRAAPNLLTFADELVKISFLAKAGMVFDCRGQVGIGAFKY